MPNIQVAAERRREVIEAHRLWVQSIPREPGQIGGTITSMIEGPALHTPGRITAYSDFEPVRFLSVNPSFVAFLRERGIPFEVN
jgi:hypothetical protein